MQDHDLLRLSGISCNRRSLFSLEINFITPISSSLSDLRNRSENTLSEGGFRRICSVNSKLLTKKPVTLYRSGNFAADSP
jgi:hypothetical protein